MIEIQVLRKYYQENKVFITEHAADRFRRRNIKAKGEWFIMRCLCCKSGNMTDSTNAYFAQINGCYVIIENVPCMKCDQCGEVYYTSSVLEKIDDILDKVENIASKIFIMDYKTAA